MLHMRVTCFLLLLALLAFAALAQYDPTKAMSSLYYCKTAYCQASDISSWGCGASCNFHAGFQVQGVYNNGTFDAQGFTGYSADGNIVVAFRGSSNIENWFADLDFKKMPYPDASCSGCEVHTGFFQVYLEMAASMLSDVQALVNKYPGAPVLVTGHSLGAAVSLHAAVDITNKINGISSLELYNFGLPRVGNPAFAAWAASILPAGKQYRVTHSRDPVPHVPPMDFGFLHAWHELWYDNNGDSSYSDCADSATAEDPNCSDSVIPIDIENHLLYLGICTECTCDSFNAKQYQHPLAKPRGYSLKN